MKEKRPIRILIGKPGLDGHDRGVKVLALGLRNEGFEVIYTGPRQTPEDIVRIAIQEDVDVIGLSSLAGAHNFYFPRVAELVSKNRMDHILVIGGGIIPNDDVPLLKERGVKAIFRPGARIKDIADFVRKNVKHTE
jgi:methylmalonyl-CoA mutase C-terminal domain/subunit